MKKNICSAAVARVTAVVFVLCSLTAEAVKVHNTVNAGDSRYFTTGCKYDTALAGGKASIGMWVKNMTAHSNPGAIFGNLHVNGYYCGGGLALFVRTVSSQSCFSFVVEGKDASGNWVRQYLDATAYASCLTDGQWHFLLGTVDVSADTARFYVDGALAVEKANCGLATMPLGRCFAGSCVGKTTESTTREVENYGAAFLADFAEATLWDKVLSAAEVSDLYTHRASMWDENLIGYWPLADAKNRAFMPATRADGSVPNLLFYYEYTKESSDFFADPCPSAGRFVIAPAWAQARGYTVPDGCDYSSVTQPATNIQDAVDAATSGQTVYIFSGHYPLTAALTLKDKSVNLKGLNTETFAADRDGVVIDGQGQYRTLAISRNGDYRNIVDSLTLTNGSACVRMYDSELKWSATTYTMELRNCRIVGNRVTSGNSGVYVGKQGLVSNCVIAANYSPDSSLIGWTTDFASQADVFPLSRINAFVDCLVVGNTCGKDVQLLGSGPNSAYFIGCTFSNNCYTTSGDKNSYLLTLLGYARNCTFADNCTSGGKASAVVSLTRDSSSVSNCVFRGNVSTYTIRALENQQNTHVWDTTVKAYQEGLIGSMSAHNVLVYGGSSYGYRLHCDSCAAVLENCTIVSERAGIYISAAAGTASLAVKNSIVLGGGSEDYYQNAAMTTLAITNTILPRLSCASSTTIPTGLFQNRWTRKPGFRDAAHGDYTLRPTAFARDRGVKLPWHTAGKLDLAKDPRLVNRRGVANAANALPDLGCFEQQQPIPATGAVYLK